jgi:2'-hydroxyisoflavone reductase
VTAGSAEQPARLVWVDERWLVGQDVRQWTELPLWRAASAPWGMNADRALGAGLLCRPIEQTVADTWAWLHEGGRPVSHERFAEHGIAPDKERRIIAQWRAEHPHSRLGGPASAL